MDVETRLTNLENLVLSFIKNQSIADNYKIADINGCRHTDSLQANDIKINTSGIQTNSEDIVTTQEGLAETYEQTNTSITQLEEALVEVYEIIIPKE